MAKSLYDVIIQVNDAYDKVAEHTSVDRTPALKKAYESYKHNPIIDAVMRGNTSFMNELLEYSKGEETRKQYLEECLGLKLPRSSTNKEIIMGGAALGAVIGIVDPSPNLPRRGILTRRDMIRIVFAALAGAGTATGVDFVITNLNRAGLSDYFQRAQFLDDTYRRIR